jgi:hypothetical protein
MSVLRYSIIIAILSSINADAHAVTWEPDSIKKFASQAHIIARVRISSWELARTLVNGKEQACGYVFEAIVTEGLKGEARKLEFLSTVHEPSSIEIGAEYVVFAFKSEGWLDVYSILREGDDPELRSKTYCRIIAADYYLPWTRNLLLKFDKNAAEQFGGEWVEFSGPFAAPDDTTIETRQTDPSAIPPSPAVWSWSDIVQIIEGAPDP